MKNKDMKNLGMQLAIIFMIASICALCAWLIDRLFSKIFSLQWYEAEEKQQIFTMEKLEQANVCLWKITQIIKQLSK